MWQFVLLGTALLVTGGRCQSVTEVYAEAGSRAVLPCICRSTSSSAATIHWSRVSKSTVWRKAKSGLEYWGIGANRVRVPQSHTGAGEYNLYIKDVRREDGGKYTCMVEDGEKRVTSNVLLMVIQVSISPSAPVEGDKMTITCSVTPWPTGATVSWMLNEKTIHPESADYVLSKTQVYVLQTKASDSMAGNWSCVVGSDGRTPGNASTPLTVRGIVKPSRDSASVYAELGAAVTLPCVFSSGLTPSKPVWERLGRFGSVLPLPPSFNTSFLPPRQVWDMSVVVGEVRQGDAGRYRCSATVEGIRVVREMQLVTSQVFSNEALTQKTPATLTCHLSNTSEVTDYEWVQVNSDPNNTQSVSSFQKGRVLKINKETDRNSGQWVCRFYGKQGVLGNVTYHIPLMSGQMGESKPESSGNAGVVLGLGILLLLLLLVFVKMYKNHRRRQMILQYPAMETIVHSIFNEREERHRERVKEDDISK
ncbi:hypothetical protein UPYG_G00153030 [Umbra pygmaea]|uniref:Ig-like domain-containing protein n=1 Tax=Umbra pygmaea TaxID=75934 RepID=A0ABD0WXF0_UMBPY